MKTLFIAISALAALYVLAAVANPPSSQEATHKSVEPTGTPSPWKRPPETVIKTKLSAEQYYVTQEDGTERAFRNTYWNNGKAGIYVDVVSGEPLFSSREKFKSGTGWPSFFTPLEPDNIVEHEDRKLFWSRTEVRSRHGDSH